MASLSTCFVPYAQSRPPRTPNPRRSSPTKQSRARNPIPKLKSRPRPGKKDPSSVAGVEATTYTRLPPKEDFSLSSFDSSSLQFSDEVRLSDSAAAAEIRLEAQTLIDEDEEIVEENGVVGDDWDSSYGKFEVFEANGDEDEGDWEGSADEFEADSEEIRGKEKGVPAVMRCFDRAKVFAKAGNGGNGVVAFRREKFVPLGGPSGGDGGRGGNVYVEVDGAMNSLLPFRKSVHFWAGRGAHGRGKMQVGAKGEDVVVKVPPGTVVREAGGEAVLLELLRPGQRGLLLPGGRGGRGNASFKSGTNKVPRIAENGEEGPEM